MTSHLFAGGWRPMSYKTSMSRQADVWLVGGEDVRFRIPLLLELSERGFAVAGVGSESGVTFEDHGIPYHRYSLSRALDPLGDLRSYRQLRRIFLEHAPSVVHAFDTKPAMLAPFAAAGVGVPVRVRTVTGMGHVFSDRAPRSLMLRPVYRRMQRAASRAVSLTIFQNSDDHEYFLDNEMVAAASSAIVPGSGIDAEQVQGRRPSPAALQVLRKELGLGDGPVVTMVARLVRYKGVREFCQAARSVRLVRPECTFLLVGPLGSEGKQAVRRSEVENHPDVRWLGPRDDVPALLALTDVFVLPSYYREGVPRVLLEAGAMGLPLVSTDMPGCREVVRDGWNGALVPARDAMALARSLTDLLDGGPEGLARMGERSRSHVAERFTLAHVADAYSEIYQRLLAQAGTHGGSGKRAGWRGHLPFIP